jgi:signal transduction histidine kinase
MQRSLKFKLILAFNLVALLPLVTMAVLYFQTLYSTLVNAAQQELQVGARQVTEDLDVFFRENIVNLRSQSQLSDFANYLYGDSVSRQRAEPHLSVLLKSLARVDNQAYVQAYLLLDKNGTVVYDQSQRDIGKDLSDAPFFLLTWQGDNPQVVLTEPDSEGQRSIYFAVLIWDDDNVKIGVFAHRYSLAIVQSLVSKFAGLAGETSFAIVLENNGHVVAWNKSISPPLAYLDVSIFKDIHFARQVTLNNETYALAHLTLEYAPLCVLYVQPEYAITDYVLSHVNSVGLLSISILGLSLWMALFLSDRIARPINELTRTAKSLQNDLNARVQIASQDEIGLLGETFNQMAAQIQAEIQEVREAENRYRDLSISLEHMVNQRTEALQKANQELESFSYSVSHDLRAPLRAIDGYSRMAQDQSDGLDAETLGYLARIRAASRQMSQLIDGLLALSRLGRQTLRITPLSATQVRHMIDRVIADLNESTPDRLVEWQISELPACEADFTLLTQVFANLLGNAHKYTRYQHPAVIEIGFSGEAYFVRDNGAGFDMRYANKLFGVFQRLHREEEFDGTGIGLATVKRIIERHHGKIWAEAEVNKGATFYFMLGDAHESGKSPG